jgi:aspartate/methionine/tyrosine aminotransferase
MPPVPPRVARRTNAIAPFHVMALLARAHELEAEGRSIIHMEVGEPDFPTAEPVLAAGHRALSEGRTRYTAAAGIPELRRSIAEYYRSRYGVSIPPGRIIVTPGASGALQLATAVLVDPGERVLMTDPGYPCNRHFVSLVEGEPICIPVSGYSAYQLSPATVDEHWTDGTVAVLLASPSNPTGTLVPRAAMKGIVELAETRGGHVIVDEIYQELTYESETATVLTLSDQVFVVNSFSKYFGMTGWRLGWLVAPEAYVSAVEKLAQNLFLAPSAPAQYAALAAFGPDATVIFEARRRELRRRRDFLLPALRDSGFLIPVVPEGAFYLYADCSRFTDDSYAFAMELLERTGVAITPGIDFGAHEAERHVRFAYTTSLENLAEGVRRLRKFLL